MLLYSRVDCHLCELAAGMLDRAAIRWREVDIDGDPALAERYGLRVPVVRRPGDGCELDYPFDQASLQRFIETV